jgi:hypothetical protein
LFNQLLPYLCKELRRGQAEVNTLRFFALLILDQNGRVCSDAGMAAEGVMQAKWRARPGEFSPLKCKASVDSHNAWVGAKRLDCVRLSAAFPHGRWSAAQAKAAINRAHSKRWRGCQRQKPARSVQPIQAAGFPG